MTIFNRKSKILYSFIVLAIGCLVFLLNPPLSLADDPPPDYVCKSCHLNDTKTLTLPSGESLSLGVDMAHLQQSVHGSQLEQTVHCTDCHRNQTRYRYPHQPNPAQNKQEFAAVVAQNCQDCHLSLQRHNPGHLLADDNSNLPTCTDCHSGGHQMATPEQTFDDEPTMCLNCHQTYTDPQLESLHQEVVPNLQAEQTCEVCHNNKPVYPDDAQCKTCHALLTNEMAFPSGETVSLHMEAEALAGSVHGQHLEEEHHFLPLHCTDCHTKRYHHTFPHDPVDFPDTRSFSLDMNKLCQQCHEDIYERQEDSTHALALADGNVEAATCADCHGSHVIPEPNNPRERISLTCAECHAEINQNYANSVHGAALLGEHNPDVPVCIDCHGVHDIEDPTTALFRVRSPRLCADCHADEALMDKYNLSTNVFDSYVADYHGTTVTLFEKQSPDHETNKAVCYDCHGVHNILATTDENALVIKENLLETCRQCHPDATANFPAAWTSHFEPSLEKNQLIYFVNLFYQFLIPITIGGFIIFIFSDIYRRTLNRLRKTKGSVS